MTKNLEQLMQEETRKREEYQRQARNGIRMLFLVVTVLVVALVVALVTDDAVADDELLPELGLADVLVVEPVDNGFTTVVSDGQATTVGKFEGISYSRNHVLVDIDGPLGEMKVGEINEKSALIIKWKDDD